MMMDSRTLRRLQTHTKIALISNLHLYFQYILYITENSLYIINDENLTKFLRYPHDTLFEKMIFSISMLSNCQNKIALKLLP